MPSVNIREIDSTSSADLTIGHEYGVLIPIVDQEGSTALTGLPKWMDDDDITMLGSGTAGRDQAILLYSLGAPVFLVNASSAKPSDFEDRNQYEFRFMLKGDGTVGSQASAADWSAENMTVACAKRGDAIALLNAQIPGVAHSESGEGRWTTKTIERQGVTWTTSESVFQYAASFVGGVTFTYTDNADDFDATTAFLDCFYTYLKAGYPEWFAFAGFTRGKSYYDFKASNMIDTTKITEAVIKTLQPRTGTADDESGATYNTHCANVFTTIRPAGDIVWGNRTAEVVDVDKGLRACNFLNIRNLCCTIKKVAYDASKKYTFEPNSDVLWANWTGEIVPTLEKMRANQGIRGYKITKESVKGQKALIVATITIAPIEAVEDFDITIDLVNSVE